MKLNYFFGVALFAATVMSGSVHATTLVDTGMPSGGLFSAVTLDGADYAASKFHLGASYDIDSVAGYLLGGDSGLVGDTFTIALYQDNNGHVGSPLQSIQAKFLADGWNGVSGLNWHTGPGDYWLAFEVGSADNTAGLLLPIMAPNPALATAFLNDGSGYHTFAGFDYGVRVSGVAAVPVPAAGWLFVSGLLAIGGVKRRSV